MHARVHSIKVYTDKQYTVHTFHLVLTANSQWYHGWFSSSMKAPVSQDVINFLNVLWAGVVAVGRSCYPLPLIMESVATGRRLNCELVTYIPAFPCLTRRLHSGSVCVLMSSIRISLVVVFFTLYRRCSLSYDIVAMCGWRLISWYRLVDIIPSVHQRNNYYRLDNDISHVYQVKELELNNWN